MPEIEGTKGTNIIGVLKSRGQAFPVVCCQGHQEVKLLFEIHVSPPAEHIVPEQIPKIKSLSAMYTMERSALGDP
jgi:hypothetical protein